MLILSVGAVGLACGGAGETEDVETGVGRVMNGVIDEEVV